MSKFSPLTYIGARTKASYHWQKTQSTVDWAESNIYLHSDTSPVTGMLDLKYSPHLKEMFDDYDKTNVWQQIGKFSTQSGKTLWIQVCMAKTLDTKPAKLQYAIPNEDKVSEYLTDKITPFLKGIKSLNLKIEDYKDKEKVRLKLSRIKIAGGDCVFTGSSASSKRSKSVRQIFMDELDLMTEGSFIEFSGRTKASEKFGRKILAASSQKRANGEVSKAYNGCETIKEWSKPCIKCNHSWFAGSKDLKWIKREQYVKDEGLKSIEDIDNSAYKSKALEEVYVECPNCHHRITSAEKDSNILSGKYKFKVVKGVKNGNTIGYAGNALSMFFTTFESIAGLIIDAEYNGTFDDMSQIYLDYFDEIYKVDIKEADKNDILLLSNYLSEKEIPENTYKLYLTIDTQKTGFWFKITAVEYGVIFNTVYHGFVETFDELEMLMGYRFKDIHGNIYIVDKTMIDRMGIRERTVEVDAWIENLIINEGMEGKIYPTMGIQSDASGRLWYYTTLTKDITTGDRKVTPVQAVKLNNTLLKNELQNYIDRTINKVLGIAGYENAHARLYYINDDIVKKAESREASISTDYERQMTSERYIYKADSSSGKIANIQTWEKKSNTIDNHLFDCSVQAVACALMDNVSLAQQPTKNDFEDALSMLGFN